MVSLTQVVVVLAVAYICHTIYSLYEIFKVPVCTGEAGSRCLHSYLARKPLMQMQVYTKVVQSQKGSLVWTSHPFNVHQAFNQDIKVRVPMQTRRNGSLHVRVLLTQAGHQEASQQELGQVMWTVSRSSPLTSFALPQPSQFKLMGDNNETTTTSDFTTPTSHWHSKLFLCIVEETLTLDARNIPLDVAQHVKMLSEKEYLPIMYIDQLSLRNKHLMELKESSSEMDLEVVMKAVSFGKMRFFLGMQQSLSSFTALGFSDKDLDEVKGIFVDTNLLLLLLTFVVSAVHLLFDMLAFKSDISFWSKNKHMQGLSTTSTTWRCVSSVIIFFFLLDQQTSLLILIPSAISLIIENNSRFQHIIPNGNNTKSKN